MEQLWTDVLKWLRTVDWGTAPDWLAAIGTVGALFLALGILTTDRRRARRSDADAFSTSYVLRFMDHPSAGTDTTLIISSHNSGASPITVALVRSPEQKDGYTYEFLSAGMGIHPIAPGETVAKEIAYNDTPPDYNDLIVVFVDGKGRRWYRELVSGKYLSERKAIRRIGSATNVATGRAATV